jgi:transcriptional regulator with XRE-family HTH domain
MATDKTRRAICAAVAHILQEERNKRGLSLTAVATGAGLSRQMISFVEQETRNPTLDTVLRICDAIGVDFETVLKRAKRQARK